MLVKNSITLVALLVPAVAFAEVDTSEWACEFCPFEAGYTAHTDAGATYVSDDAARFGNATGYDEKGAYLNVSGDGNYAAEAYRLSWHIEDLGLDSRVLEIDGGKQGVFGFNIDYRELPYRRFDTTRTIFTRSANDTLTLPNSWVRAGLTTGMTQLASSLQAQNIESDRQVLGIGGNWLASERIDIYADFQRQNRDGVKITGGAGFTQASLLPRFFDYETDQIDAGIRYAFDSGHIGLSYYGSFFTNSQESVTWETPFLTAPGAESLRKGVAPDNDFQQFALSGALRAALWDTQVRFSLANGRGDQNEAFLPYAINPNTGAGSLPRSSLDAEVDTSNYALTITSRPIEKGRLRFAYRRDERENNTAVSDWNRVIVDIFNSGDVEQNVPYSFDRSRIDLSGEIVTWKGIRLSGGYTRKETNRDFQEVAEQTVDSGWGQVRWRPLDWLNLRVKGGTEERNIDRYNETVAVSLGQNPLLRKYNLAYRFRSWGELVATVALPDARWSITTTAHVAEDRFNQSLLGMTDSEELRFTADFSFAVSEYASFFVVAGREEIDALQAGSEEFASSDWLARHDDDFTHAGFGANWRDADGKMRLRFSWNRATGDTLIRLDSGSGGSSTLPELESTLDSARVDGSWRLTERVSATANLRYERFKMNDWALVAPNTLPTVLTLGAEPYDYDVWALGLGIRYTFGDQNVQLPGTSP